MSIKENDPAQDMNKTTPPSGDTAAQAGASTVGNEAVTEAATEADTLAATLAAAEAAQADGPAAAEDKGGAVHAEAVAAADPAASAAAEAAVVAAEPAPEPEPEPEIPGQLPGEVLAARRQEMRLSIEELSARVKLAPRQLIALEANDFGSLPGMATTRGFIRSCAKALSLDPEPLLAMVAHEPNPALGPMVMRRPLPQPGFNGRRYAPSTSHRRGANKLSGLAAVVLIFVGMLAYVAWRNDWLHLPSLDLSAARDAIMSPSAGSDPEQDAQAPAADTAAEPAASAPPAANAAAAAKPAPAATADAEVYAPKAPAPAATPAASAAAKAAPAANIDAARALELKLREDAWVEVLTQNGERKLVSRLMKAGSTERVEVTEPVTLIVGNAAGVDVTLRGQPVSLKAGTRDNVAKVNLK